MSIKTKMTTIANAIRKKTGVSAKLTLDNMAEKIGTLAEPFWKDNAKGTTTQSQIIDSDLDVIRPYAFYGLKGVTTMTFQNENLTEIGENAFEQCSVKNLTLPSGITSLSKEMFANSSLTSFSATGVNEVGEGCFKNTYLTVTPDLSADVSVIPNYFCYTRNAENSLKELHIPYNCTEIGYYAYNNISGINVSNNPALLTDKQNFVGQKVETMGSGNFTNIFMWMFSQTNNYVYKVLDFPKLINIKHNCFSGSKGGGFDIYKEEYKKDYHYYTYNFPKLEKMGHSNFKRLPLKTLSTSNFPVLTTMGQDCFSDNDLLTWVNIPLLNRFMPLSEETIVQSDWLNEDDSNEFLGYPDSIPGPFTNCSSLTTIILPALLDFNIPLKGCSVLKTIDLTAVTNITTFETSSLNNLIIRNETPPVLNIRRELNEDIYFPDTISIYVPDPTLYENLDNWSYYYSLGCIKSLDEYTG